MTCHGGWHFITYVCFPQTFLPSTLPINSPTYCHLQSPINSPTYCSLHSPLIPQLTAIYNPPLIPQLTAIYNPPLIPQLTAISIPPLILQLTALSTPPLILQLTACYTPMQFLRCLPHGIVFPVYLLPGLYIAFPTFNTSYSSHTNWLWMVHSSNGKGFTSTKA